MSLIKNLIFFFLVSGDILFDLFPNAQSSQSCLFLNNPFFLYKLAILPYTWNIRHPSSLFRFAEVTVTGLGTLACRVEEKPPHPYRGFFKHLVSITCERHANNRDGVVQSRGCLFMRTSHQSEWSDLWPNFRCQRYLTNHYTMMSVNLLQENPNADRMVGQNSVLRFETELYMTDKGKMFISGNVWTG